MDNDLNPFPSYPVIRLNAEAGQVERTTVLTPAIIEARTRVDHYTEQWRDRKSNPTRKIDVNINAVRGDYGTGKTHLLLDAIARLDKALIGDYPDLKIIRVASLETNALNWFRNSIGPQLNPTRTPGKTETEPGFIEQLLLRLYAEAGRTVASRAKLTVAAVDTLTENPAAIRTLVKENLLDMSAVDQEFGKLLQEICQEEGDGKAEGIIVREDVRRALAATVWPDTATPALRWLAGQPLNEIERRELRLSGDLSDVDDAGGVLIALAAAHYHLQVPFALVIDEFEHLTRYDKSHNAGANINWLKRLLESLAAHRALVFVSGHWSGWDVQSDFLDRFKPLRPIELVKLTANDILRIVRARIPNLDATSFGMAQAEALERSSDGNIRRALALCVILFRETSGFRMPVTTQLIEKLAGQIAKSITPEAASVSVRATLEQQGLSVLEQAITDAGIRFDLIGYKGNQIKAVVEFEHAVHQVDLHDAAKVFLDRVERVFSTTPDVVACFIADGNIDDSLLALLNTTRPFKFLWYDLTKEGVLAKIADDLRAHLNSGVDGTRPMDTRAAELTVRKNESEELITQLGLRIQEASATANAGLVAQLQEQRDIVELQLDKLNEQILKREEVMRAQFLQSVRDQMAELDAKRNAEIQDLYKRLEVERQKVNSQREEEVVKKQEGEESPKLHATYTELTRPLTLGTKLRMALTGPSMVLVLILITTGMMLLFFGDVIARGIAEYEYIYNRLRIMLLITGLVTVFFGVLVIWMRLTRLDVFLNYSARTLREIYIRTERVEALVRVDNILRDSLETYGLFQWKEKADVRLWNEFEPFLGEPPEHVIEAWRKKYESKDKMSA